MNNGVQDNKLSNPRSMFKKPIIPTASGACPIYHALPTPTPSPSSSLAGDTIQSPDTLFKGVQLALSTSDRRYSRRQRDLSPESFDDHTQLSEIELTGPTLHIVPSITMSLRIKIDRFQTGVDTVDEWVSDFERKSNANGWSDANKLSCLPCFLSGAPLQWFLDMEATHQKEANPPPLLWGTVKASLLSAFAADLQQGFRNQLRERVQGPSEANDDYIYDVVRLCNKVNPNMDELDRVQQIMSGLLPSVLDKISMLENRTMAELLANVKRAMVSRNMLLNRMCPTTSTRQQTAPAASVTVEPSLRDTVDRLSRDMISQQEAFVAFMQHQQLQSQHNLFHQPPMPLLAQPPGASMHMAQHPYHEVSVAPVYMQPQHGPRNLNRNRPTGPDMGRNRHIQRTHDGRPVCYLCFRAGHVMLQCPQLDHARSSVQAGDFDGPNHSYVQGNDRPQTQ